jgi:UDP-N-acetylglucosamine--N-acetylmuramyl-(pentapeptide) pyrophosphoryl-undecaprenol N-acetylglucosamine transferase
MSERRILVMAGGTGGHVFPALAVAAEMRARGYTVDWLGTSAGIEADLVPAEGYALHTIRVQGVRGKKLLARLLAPLQVCRAVFQALLVVRSLRPCVVIGLGGYASGPGGAAARLLGIPLVIHEQNAVAGTTNRILSKLAKRVLQAFPGAFEGAAVVGNPVRAQICQLPEPAERGIGAGPALHLLVLGGSLGALAINKLVPQALALLNAGESVEVRHQCGRAHLEITASAYRKAGVSADIQPFISDMAAAYRWADFVICRAGALTVSEIAAAGVGSLLIPFPAAIDDHQTKNGQWLVAGGAAQLVQQRDLTAEILAAKIKELLANQETIKTMAVNARKLAIVNAACKVADVCEEVAA